MRAAAPPSEHALSAPVATHAHDARSGVLFGVAAYGLWGLFPIYFKAVATVPTLEVLAHRVVWSAAFLLLIVAVRRNGRALRDALRDRHTLGILAITTLLIAGNWLGFIWAVANGHIMQSSLGYFINPLISVLLGFVFLRERLRPWQGVSVAIATAAVLYLTFLGGQFPALALYLAGSFGAYGLLRKLAPVGPLVGLTIETSLLVPLAIVFLGYRVSAGSAVFGNTTWSLNALLLLAGVLTATPLLWFAAAARRLRLATLGFLQYLVPTGHFLLALAYGEPMSRARWVTFACIWVALAIYTLDSLSARRQTEFVEARGAPR
jgi:chloramphenicol-sensitive protein RarD